MTIAVTRMHEIFSHSVVMSRTVALTTNVTCIAVHSFICISRQMCLDVLNELFWCLYQNVCIDIQPTLLTTSSCVHMDCSMIIADIVLWSSLIQTIVKRKINSDKSIKSIDFKLVTDLQKRRWHLWSDWLTESIIWLHWLTRVFWFAIDDRHQIKECVRWISSSGQDSNHWWERVKASVQVRHSLMNLLFCSTDLSRSITLFKLQLQTYSTSTVSTILLNRSDWMIQLLYLNDSERLLQRCRIVLILSSILSLFSLQIIMTNDDAYVYCNDHQSPLGLCTI